MKPATNAGSRERRTISRTFGATQGGLAGARTLYEEAVAIFREAGEQRGMGYAQSGLGRVSLAQGRFADARTHHEAALAIRTQIDDPGTMAESRVFLAELAIEEGHARDGETLARSAAEHFTREGIFDQAAAAYAVVARARRAQNNIAGAREAADRATALTAKLQNRYVKLSTSVDVARVHGAGGREAEAVRILEATLKEANTVDSSTFSSRPVSPSARSTFAQAGPLPAVHALPPWKSRRRRADSR